VKSQLEEKKVAFVSFVVLVHFDGGLMLPDKNSFSIQVESK
jgi:hypothetical protein